MSDDTIRAAVLRIQAEGLRRHANKLDDLVEAQIRFSGFVATYQFARDRACEEADVLEEQARELEGEDG